MSPKTSGLTLSSHYHFVEEEFVTHGLGDGPVKGEKDFHSLYELGEIIGYGTYSEVRFASSKRSGVIYACKIVNKQSLKQPWRLREEIKILKAVQHSNIISLHDIFETKSEVLLVLDLATGGELYNHIVERQRYSEQEACQIVKSLIHATSFLHSKNVIHRDIKPENILLASEKSQTRVLISDFGLAKVLDETYDSDLETDDEEFMSDSSDGCQSNPSSPGGRSRANTSCGSDYYVAPEILNGESYDEKVDMWSIGVVMFVLLCGNHPFESEDGDLRKVYDDIRTGNYSFSAPVWQEVSPAAKDLVARFLTVDPEKRITSSEASSHVWLRSL